MGTSTWSAPGIATTVAVRTDPPLGQLPHAARDDSLPSDQVTENLMRMLSTRGPIRASAHRADRHAAQTGTAAVTPAR